MNNPDALEDEIVTLIAPVLAPIGVSAAPLPEDDTGYERPWKNGRVFVVYHSSKYESEEDSQYKRQRAIGAVIQDQIFDLVIHVEGRNRRGTAGNHDIIAKVKTKLLGYSPASSGPLYLVDDSYQGREAGVWSHVLTFRGRSLAVQAHRTDEEDTAAPLNTVTYNVLEP